MNNILSKIILFYRIKSTEFYLFKRKKFPNYFEKKELNFLFNTCNKMVPVINEMNHFYKKVSSFNVSYIEKEEKGVLNNTNYTYGEMNWETAIKVLNQFDIKENDALCDLGCGNAKIVFLANLKYGIKSFGIDIIDNFIKISNIIKKKLDLKNIYFKNNDFLKENLKEYNLFFITATCFDNKIFEKLVNKLESLDTGTKIAIVTKEINKEKFILYKVIRSSFSWGLDYIYFYEIRK